MLEFGNSPTSRLACIVRVQDIPQLLVREGLMAGESRERCQVGEPVHIGRGPSLFLAPYATPGQVAGRHRMPAPVFPNPVLHAWRVRGRGARPVPYPPKDRTRAPAALLSHPGMPLSSARHLVRCARRVKRLLANFDCRLCVGLWLLTKQHARAISGLSLPSSMMASRSAATAGCMSA